MRAFQFLKCTLMVLPFIVTTWGAPSALASPMVDLDQAVHVTTADGGDVVLGAGSYVVEPAEEWLRITPSGGTPVDALLIETQVGRHEEALEAPLALSMAGEKADTHYLVLLLPDGKRLETVGTYSGVRSRGRSFFLTRQQLQAMIAAKRRAQRTEFSTPLFGGSGGNRTYNLDCGSNNVMVGAIFKAGSWLDALGIICQRVNPQTGALGREFTRGPVGGSGGTARIRRCNRGNVVTELRAFSGQFINEFSVSCGRWVPSRKAPDAASGQCSRGTDQCLRVGKSSPGNAVSDVFECPPGMVGKAFRGKRGIYIDSARFVCDAWDR